MAEAACQVRSSSRPRIISQFPLHYRSEYTHPEHRKQRELYNDRRYIQRGVMTDYLSDENNHLRRELAVKRQMLFNLFVSRLCPAIRKPN